MKHLGILAVFLYVVATPCWAGFDEGQAAYERGDYATAFREWLPLAQQGHAKAQYNLASMYKRGLGVPQNITEAIQWYRQAAEQGDGYAQLFLGNAYSLGTDVPQNITEAIQWYRRAAEQGDGNVQLIAVTNLATMYYFGIVVPQNYVEAARWYRRAAEHGDASHQLFLGDMYEQGKGVPQNYPEAVQWYRRAAEHGQPVAQNALGSMYKQGKGVPQHYMEATKWYRRAAEQGNAEAQYNLGLMYEKGQGVPRDYTEAYLWLNLAAARWPPYASSDSVVRSRDSVAEWLTPSQLARAQELARTWQPRPERPETSGEPSPKVATPSHLVQTASPCRALIRQVQERLQAAGFNPGALDGALGPQTRNALRSFQYTKGLQATGEPDEGTLDALGVR